MENTISASVQNSECVKTVKNNKCNHDDRFISYHRVLSFSETFYKGETIYVGLNISSGIELKKNTKNPFSSLFSRSISIKKAFDSQFTTKELHVSMEDDKFIAYFVTEDNESIAIGTLE